MATPVPPLRALRPPDRDFSPFLDAVRTAPADGGLVEHIVLRPAVDQRVIAHVADLDVVDGVVGDTWRVRGSSRTPDGLGHPDSQVTLMSVRVLAAIEPDRSRWPLAGDQFLVDADLSIATLPVGSRFLLGSAVLEVSAMPHTGCAKFSARFGSDALRWTNAPLGRELRMRGMNATIIQGGQVRVGDAIRRL